MKHVKTWIKAFIKTRPKENACAKVVKVVKKEGTRRDGSIVKITTDGDVSIRTVFTTSSLERNDEESLSQSETWNSAVLILQAFRLELEGIQTSTPEYVLIVDRFKLWDLQPGFEGKFIYDAKPCMQCKDIRKLSLEEQAEAREAAQRTREPEQSQDTSSVSLSQLLNELACASSPSQSDEAGNQQASTSENQSAPDVHVAGKVGNTCSASLMESLFKPFTVKEFLIPCDEQMQLDQIKEWQTDYIPSASEKSASGADVGGGTIGPQSVSQLEIDRPTLTDKGERSRPQNKGNEQHKPGTKHRIVNILSNTQSSTMCSQQSQWQNQLDSVHFSDESMDIGSPSHQSTQIDHAYTKNHRDIMSGCVDSLSSSIRTREANITNSSDTNLSGTTKERLTCKNATSGASTSQPSASIEMSKNRTLVGSDGLSPDINEYETPKNRTGSSCNSSESTDRGIISPSPEAINSQSLLLGNLRTVNFPPNFKITPNLLANKKSEVLNDTNSTSVEGVGSRCETPSDSSLSEGRNKSRQSSGQTTLSDREAMMDYYQDSSLSSGSSSSEEDIFCTPERKKSKQTRCTKSHETKHSKSSEESVTTSNSQSLNTWRKRLKCLLTQWEKSSKRQIEVSPYMASENSSEKSKQTQCSKSHQTKCSKSVRESVPILNTQSLRTSRQRLQRHQAQYAKFSQRQGEQSSHITSEKSSTESLQSECTKSHQTKHMNSSQAVCTKTPVSVCTQSPVQSPVSQSTILHEDSLPTECTQSSNISPRKKPTEVLLPVKVEKYPVLSGTDKGPSGRLIESSNQTNYPLSSSTSSSQYKGASISSSESRHDLDVTDMVAVNDFYVSEIDRAKTKNGFTGERTVKSSSRCDINENMKSNRQNDTGLAEGKLDDACRKDMGQTGGKGVETNRTVVREAQSIDNDRKVADQAQTVSESVDKNRIVLDHSQTDSEHVDNNRKDIDQAQTSTESVNNKNMKCDETNRRKLHRQCDKSSRKSDTRTDRNTKDKHIISKNTSETKKEYTKPSLKLQKKVKEARKKDAVFVKSANTSSAVAPISVDAQTSVDAQISVGAQTVTEKPCIALSPAESNNAPPVKTYTSDWSNAFLAWMDKKVAQCKEEIGCLREYHVSANETGQDQMCQSRLDNSGSADRRVEVSAAIDTVAAKSSGGPVVGSLKKKRTKPVQGRKNESERNNTEASESNADQNRDNLKRGNNVNDVEVDKGKAGQDKTSLKKNNIVNEAGVVRSNALKLEDSLNDATTSNDTNTIKKTGTAKENVSKNQTDCKHWIPNVQLMSSSSTKTSKASSVITPGCNRTSGNTQSFTTNFIPSPNMRRSDKSKADLPPTSEMCTKFGNSTPGFNPHVKLVRVPVSPLKEIVKATNRPINQVSPPGFCVSVPTVSNVSVSDNNTRNSCITAVNDQNPTAPFVHIKLASNSSTSKVYSYSPESCNGRPKEATHYPTLKECVEDVGSINSNVCDTPAVMNAEGAGEHLYSCTQPFDVCQTQGFVPDLDGTLSTDSVERTLFTDTNEILQPDDSNRQHVSSDLGTGVVRKPDPDLSAEFTKLVDNVSDNQNNDDNKCKSVVESDMNTSKKITQLIVTKSAAKGDASSYKKLSPKVDNIGGIESNRDKNAKEKCTKTIQTAYAKSAESVKQNSNKTVDTACSSGSHLNNKFKQISEKASGNVSSNKKDQNTAKTVDSASTCNKGHEAKTHAHDKSDKSAPQRQKSSDNGRYASNRDKTANEKLTGIDTACKRSGESARDVNQKFTQMSGKASGNASSYKKDQSMAKAVDTASIRDKSPKVKTNAGNCDISASQKPGQKVCKNDSIESKKVNTAYEKVTSTDTACRGSGESAKKVNQKFTNILAKPPRNAPSDKKDQNLAKAVNTASTCDKSPKAKTNSGKGDKSSPQKRCEKRTENGGTESNRVESVNKNITTTVDSACRRSGESAKAVDTASTCHKSPKAKNRIVSVKDTENRTTENRTVTNWLNHSFSPTSNTQTGKHHEQPAAMIEQSSQRELASGEETLRSSDGQGNRKRLFADIGNCSSTDSEDDRGIFRAPPPKTLKLSRDRSQRVCSNVRSQKEVGSIGSQNDKRDAVLGAGLNQRSVTESDKRDAVIGTGLMHTPVTQRNAVIGTCLMHTPVTQRNAVIGTGLMHRSVTPSNHRKQQKQEHEVVSRHHRSISNEKVPRRNREPCHTGCAPESDRHEMLEANRGPHTGDVRESESPEMLGVTREPYTGDVPESESPGMIMISSEEPEDITESTAVESLSALEWRRFVSQLKVDESTKVGRKLAHLKRKFLSS